jgi:hypothetical protein
LPSSAWIVVFSVITLTARPDLRQAGEVKLMGWLQARQIAAIGHGSGKRRH